MRLEIEFERPSRLTVNIPEEKWKRIEEDPEYETSWQPIYDALYMEIESHLMDFCEIRDVHVKG